MSADHNGIGFRIFTDSNVVNIRPNATVELFTAGTASLIWSGTTDADGWYSVPTLATGHYDLKVDGVQVSSFHHVKSDHTHAADEPFRFFISGGITANQDEVNTVPTFYPGVAGTIEKIEITCQTDATGDVTVHLLRGPSPSGAALTVASNSVWSYQINPALVRYRFGYIDESPGLSLTATQAIALGINWTANSVSGLCVMIIFRPT